MYKQSLDAKATITWQENNLMICHSVQEKLNQDYFLDDFKTSILTCDTSLCMIWNMLD